MRHLRVDVCTLGNDGIGSMFDALALTEHLRSLYAIGNKVTAACARCRFLPAIRSNKSLDYALIHDGALSGPQEEASALLAARVIMRADGSTR